MALKCDMQLNRPDGAYQAGDTVNGHIYLTLQERALIKAIALAANGYAATAWLKPQKQSKSKKPEKKQKPPLIYEQRVDYLATVNYFVGSEVAVPKIMEAGVYHFPFSVKLPEHGLSSFEGEHGHIRYTLQLLLHTGQNKESQVLYSRRLQLQQRAEQCAANDQLPTVSELQFLEQTSRMKFWQRPLLLDLNIPQRVYAPGDGVSVHVKLQNPQRLPLSELIYKLNRLTTYVGQQQGKPKRRDTRIEHCNLLSSVQQLSSLPRSDFFQDLYTLQLPETPPTLSATNCQCLQLSYELEVTVKTKQGQRLIIGQLPLVVGSNQLAACSRQRLQPPTHISSGANLTVSRSLDDISSSGLDDIETLATAPQRTPLIETAAISTPNLCVSMTSLASNFREADFMLATNLNKRDRHAMSGEQNDFKPRYLYYEMEHAEDEKML